MDKELDTILDNVPSKSLKISITKRPTIPAPQQMVETIIVEGRHGSLTRLGAFQDISFEIEYNILEMENIKPQLRKIRGYFFGKKTLKFSDDNVYFKIKSLQISETNNEIEQYGLFTVNFVCDPFQYQTKDSLILIQPATVINNGTFESEPLLVIYGTGDITLTINSRSFIVKGLVDYVEIDSELKEAHRDTLPRNNTMIGEFPIFTPGNNEISWVGNVTKLEIEPRWRYI